MTLIRRPRAECTISVIDEGLLLTNRLQEAGLDATVALFPGEHAIGDRVLDLDAYLLVQHHPYHQSGCGLRGSLQRFGEFL